MANTHTTLTDLFTDVADAIRVKNGSTEAIIADNFPTEIENLRTGLTYYNHKITSIADCQFKNCEDLYHVNCYNLTSIGEGAFENCTNLQTIFLWDSVTDVGENAFRGCDNLTIYCTAESKPDTWHENWNPDNCEVVWGIAPVETLDISATKDGSVVAKLYTDFGSNGMYLSVISGNRNMENIGNLLSIFGTYANNIKHVIIENGVTSIGIHAFCKCASLTSITIPDSITSIGEGAFYSCKNITSINIPDSVTSIGREAFYYCSSLTNITIPDGVTSIGRLVFSGCESLTSITIPFSVAIINIYAFIRCEGLTSITYTGTISQWNKIELESGWDHFTGTYTIHCTDGDITKDGTITYHTTE